MSGEAAKWISLLFSLMILGNAWAARRFVGTWLAPACLFSLFWFALSFMPIVLIWSAAMNPWSVLFIWGASAAFCLSALPYFKWRDAFAFNAGKEDVADVFNTPFLWLAFVSASGLAMTSFLLNMRTQGFNLQDLVFQSVTTAATYRASRNEQLLNVNMFSKMEVGFAYIAVTVGGLLFATARRRSSAAVALAGSFAPALAQLLLQGAKGLMFQFISLFFAGVLVVRLFRGKTFLINSAGLRRGILIAAVVAPLTVMSILSRGLSASDRAVVTRIVKSIAASYALGHMYAFSDWVSFRLGEPSELRYPIEPTGYGFYTFTPYFKALGSMRQTPPGTYDDYYTDGELLTTNIFTMFRGSIIDFGVVGALVYTFLTGFLAHLAFYFLLAKRRPFVSAAVYIFLLGYIYSSMMVSFVAYNVTTLSFLALTALLWGNNIFADVRRDARDAIRGNPDPLSG